MMKGHKSKENTNGNQEILRIEFVKLISEVSWVKEESPRMSSYKNTS